LTPTPPTTPPTPPPTPPTPPPTPPTAAYATAYAAVEKIFLRWRVKDLGGDPDSEKGQAAMTALLIDCEAAAMEMLQ